MISYRPEIRQKQTLAMTPQLVQAIRLLQFSNTELEQFLDKEVLDNPLLQVAEDIWEPSAPDEAEVSGSNAPEGAGATEQQDQAPANLEISSVVGDNTVPGSAAHREPVQRLGQGATPDFELLDHVESQASLTTTLEQTIGSRILDATDRAIALCLLADLNEAGYLTTGLDVLADKLNVDEERCERILLDCQELAPAGMFARSLAECLSLQLRELDRLDPAMKVLIEHLEDVAAGRSASVRMRCGVDQDDFSDMLAEIRALNPKPGFDGHALPTQIVIADIIVRSDQADTWRVELNDEALPRVLVDRDYAATIAPSLDRTQDKQYLSNCLQRATWLEKCLDQRAQTILKVASEIVRQQEDFLRDGVSSLKPLNLSEVAGTIGVHGSTVSRATANKYIATPRGLFPLKFFFASSLSVAGGNENLSSEAVKHRVKQLTDNEMAGAILSDDAIAACLAEEGIVVARRTVAKYRDALGIGSSAQRRREMRASMAS